MYAAVERAIRLSRKLSYTGIGVAVIGACEVSHEETIQPEPEFSSVEAIAVNNTAKHERRPIVEKKERREADRIIASPK